LLARPWLTFFALWMCAVHVWGLRRALKTKIVVKLYMSLPRRTQWAVVQLLSPLFIWIRQNQLRELHTDSDTLFTHVSLVRRRRTPRSVVQS